MDAPEVWLKIRKTNITDIHRLSDLLELSGPLRSRLLQAPSFPLNIPLHIAHKIKKNTLDDPLLRQFLPLQEETVETEGFTCDPVEESHYHLSPSLLSKYRGRALLITSPACGMHCRFCFRRYFPYPKGDNSFDSELKLIAADDSLSEVILSGGDPLSLSNRHLSALMARLEKIPHIKTLRFHSRMPIGIPERIDAQFLSALQKSSLQVFFVVHSNHPLELDEKVLTALRQMQQRGVSLLCQTVLLKGVNDSFETLYALFGTLARHGIIPYYLHQLDRVAGGAHFFVEESRGIALMKQLQEHLPGYALPRYVKEVPGNHFKTIIY